MDRRATEFNHVSVLILATSTPPVVLLQRHFAHLLRTAYPLVGRSSLQLDDTDEISQIRALLPLITSAWLPSAVAVRRIVS